MDHRLVRSRVAVGDGHAKGVGDQRGGLVAVDRPADHPAGEHIQHHTAVHLALAGGCSVMSVTHNWSGAGRSNRRSTRSAVVAMLALLRNSFLDPGSPCRPLRRMILRTVLRWTITPWPYVSS